jgi:signal transduction histidine kinase
VSRAPTLSPTGGLGRLVGWWRTLPVLLRDATGAVLLAAVAFTPEMTNSGIVWGGLPPRRPDALAAVLVLAQCLPLAVRRRWPAACCAVVAAAFAAHQLLGYPPALASLGLLLALHGVGSYQGRLRRGVAATLTGAYVLVSVTMHTRGSRERPIDYATFYLLLLACWVGGALARARRAGELDRQRRSAQVAAAEERARIARELHDVVTHHVTAMVVQADAAQVVLAQAPPRAAAGLTAISDTGRRALAELRHLLDVLGAPGDAAGREPIVGRLHDLVERTRAAGQPVELTVDGEPQPVPGGAELAAYRVVQEALTNAIRHAAGHRTVVRVRYGTDGIDVDVATDGPVTRGARPGRGLAGLRERVGVLGGELAAGERPGGGFTVHARVPLGSDR